MELTPDQAGVIDSAVESSEINVKSGHGIGKSCLDAIIALWFKYSFRPSAVITTAPTERQVKEILWRELRFRKARALKPLEGKPTLMKLDLGPIDYAIGFSTDDIQRAQGFHSPFILVIVDEANGFPEEMWPSIESILSGGEKTLLVCTGNPINPVGRFFRAFSNPEASNFTISCLTHPNVISGKNIIPGAVTRSWVKKQELLWGKDSPFYQSRVLGQFPRISSDLIVNLCWFELAEQVTRRIIDKDELYLGGDFAEYGDDKHVWYIGTRTAKVCIEERRNIEPAEAASHTIGLIRRYNINPENVSLDGIGVGAGIFSVVKQEFPKINRFVSSESAVRNKTFVDRGIEAWWNVRDMLNPESVKYNKYSFGGPEDFIKADICTRKYKTDTRTNRLALEPKPEYRKRMKRSPDYGDAFTICYYKLVAEDTCGLLILPDVIN